MSAHNAAYFKNSSYILMFPEQTWRQAVTVTWQRHLTPVFNFRLVTLHEWIDVKICKWKHGYSFILRARIYCSLTQQSQTDDQIKGDTFATRNMKE